MPPDRAVSPPLALGLLLVTACGGGNATMSTDDTPTAPAPARTPHGANAGAPVAPVVPHVTQLHGEELHDDYYWMRYREDARVIEYLEAENAFLASKMGHTAPVQVALFDEMLAHVQEDDQTVPVERDGWLYYSRTEKGKAYKIHCRREGSMEAPEQVILDENALAEGKKYMSVAVARVSPDHRWLAYSVDLDGAERYVLRFKDLETGEHTSAAIPDTYYSGAWSMDSKHFQYTTQDEASRPWRAHRHTLGTDGKSDTILWQEDDDAYFVMVDRTRSDAYVVVQLDSAVTSEAHVLDAHAPDPKLRVVQPRIQGVEYSIDHHPGAKEGAGRFLIRTNGGAKTFKIMEAPEATPSREHWKELIAPRKEVTLASLAVFRDHMVLLEREGGLPHLRVRPLGDVGEDHRIAFEEDAYDAWIDDNPSFDTTTLRLGYDSLTTPQSIFDYAMGAKTRELKKVKPVPGYDQGAYRSARIWATAKDGTKVPVSLVHRADTAIDGTAPMLLHGYGSYGYSYEPSFTAHWLPLLDRGFVIGIAHIRGGGEMGRAWKDDGKFGKKVNTFTDFIAAARELERLGYTASDRLAISGRSAGGLLMGAVTNMAPELFEVVLAGVPFVDVVNTMLDETIPLTVIEWEEWGNPNEAEPYGWIKQYSPYDNISDRSYPNMLIIAGLNDPRVQYWEPAKWTAKLRRHQEGDGLILLKTHMGAGHAGESGRYGRLKDRAFEYAYILDRMGRLPAAAGDATP